MLPVLFDRKNSTPRLRQETAALRHFNPAHVAYGSKPVRLRTSTRFLLRPRLCCKSRFAQAVKISAGCRRGFRVKMWGTSSPYAKLTGDFCNATEALRIGDC